MELQYLKTLDSMVQLERKDFSSRVLLSIFLRSSASKDKNITTLLKLFLKLIFENVLQEKKRLEGSVKFVKKDFTLLCLSKKSVYHAWTMQTVLEE